MPGNLILCDFAFQVTEVRAMPRRCMIALLSLLFLGVSLAHAGGDASKVEGLVGTVIAYDEIKSWTPCVRGECEGSLIVRVAKPDANQPRYVRVDFRFSMSKPPKKLVKNKRLWRFKLIRTKELDEPIDEFIIYNMGVYNRERKVRIWKIIPGAEDEKLPFEETLPSYSLPKNGFKPMSGG